VHVSLINAVEIANLFVNYSFFYAVSVAYGQMFVMVPILSNFSKYFGVETYMCALAEKTVRNMQK